MDHASRSFRLREMEDAAKVIRPVMVAKGFEEVVRQIARIFALARVYTKVLDFHLHPSHTMVDG